MTRTETFRYRHSSRQRTDPKAQQQADMPALFRGRPQVIGLTETGKSENPAGRAILIKEADKRGYAHVFNNYGEGLLVRKDWATIQTHGYDGPYIKGVRDKYPNRGLLYAQVKTHDGGNVIMLGVFHSNPDDADPKRHAQNAVIAEKVGAFHDKHRNSTDAIFFSADINVDDRTDQSRKNNFSKIMRKHGLITVWDRLHVYPDTHDTRTIDVIVCQRVKKNPRVSVLGTRVFPKKHSDHKVIQARFKIKGRA